MKFLIKGIFYLFHILNKIDDDNNNNSNKNSNNNNEKDNDNNNNNNFLTLK